MNKLIFAVVVATALVVGSKYPEQTQEYIGKTTVLVKRTASWGTSVIGPVIADVQQKVTEE